jgi:FkbM family methyltransferase
MAAERPVFIYGAGIQGQVYFDVFRALGLTVIGFIDAYTSKQSYNGLPVLRAGQVREKDAAVYISVGLISARIKTELMDLGFTRVFDFTETVLAFPDVIQALKPHSMWYAQNPSEMLHDGQIDRLRNLLADEQSRALLDRIARFRLDSSAENYPVPDARTQYFPDDVDVFGAMTRVRFVDAGAYTGDTLHSLWQACDQRGLTLEYSACFEPDPTNLTHLRDQLVELRRQGLGGRVFLYPTGVWSHAETLRFQSGRAASSRVADTSVEDADGVFCLSIDETLFAAAPNFIKMDIEGAEQQALRGASQTIQTHRPVLAVSLYHRPADLWEIPLLIEEISPGYRMYLRVYGDMLLETVLYCLPDGA